MKTVQFEATIQITIDGARCLVNQIFACPDGSEEFQKNKFHIMALLHKGILINTSGQYDRYSLRLSDWGEQYFWKVRNYMQEWFPELVENKY